VTLSIASCPRCGGYVDRNEGTDGQLEFSCIGASCGFSLAISTPADATADAVAEADGGADD
jgi:hypothetical protein